MFKPIITEVDLPSELKSHETFQLDFKGRVGPRPTYEIAKDVAAFANAQGGVILVGAFEDSAKRRLGQYSPVSEDLAATISQAYERSVRDRCFPQPVFHVARIPVEGPGQVVAVNVWPFPGQVVGVSVDLPNAYVFPYRVGVDTKFLAPEQFAMLTLPSVRRTAILLSSIPADSRTHVHLLGIRRAGQCSLDKVELLSGPDEVTMKNTVRFRTMGGDSEFTVPADSITHVWESGPGGIWSISTSTELAKTKLGNDRFLMAWPQDLQGSFGE